MQAVIVLIKPTKIASLDQSLPVPLFGLQVWKDPLLQNRKGWSNSENRYIGWNSTLSQELKYRLGAPVSDHIFKKVNIKGWSNSENEYWLKWEKVWCFHRTSICAAEMIAWSWKQELLTGEQLQLLLNPCLHMSNICIFAISAYF